ncbi:glycosyl transferase [Shewanella sp. SACH]|uniref:glycosyltransferase family 2 protein n=1 Tax=Shewanella sp. SACH TaxID=1873135 RepID=UPI0009039A53|nr:glycosyltransferase family A protein [Shewanella sp. SACH]OUS52101.1 glycosyl transferase [Shewanella sp. SACH]
MNTNTVKKNNKQIVTVAVITYHSSATVLETLDSIVNQNYGPANIELIISDDGSKDNTVRVINDWLVQHQTKFHCVKFYANKINGGISKNCNVAWKAATSEWIKTIAGDDILLPSCIADNIEYITECKNDDIAVLFSKMQSFKVSEFGIKQDLSILPTLDDQKIFQLSAIEQFRYLQRQGISGAPSAFINRIKLAAIGFADERFSMIEDHPLWFKYTSNKNKLFFMNSVTVRYRIGDSVSRSKTTLINERFIKEIINIDEEIIIPSLNDGGFLLVIRKRLWANFALLISRAFNNRVNCVSKFLLLIAFSIRPGFVKFQLSKLKRKS